MTRIVPSQVREAIANLYPWVVPGQQQMVRLHREHEGNVRAVLSLVDSIPDDLLTMSPATTVKLIQAKGEVHNALAKWQAGNYALERVIGLDRHPFAVIYEALAECGDEPFPGQDEGLAFIADDDLRRTISVDIASVKRAWSNQEFKAVTILAGSVTEALLLDAIRARGREQTRESHTRLMELGRIPANSPADSLRWGLAELNEVAHDAGVIQEPVWTQVNLARDFRNFIHPGKELRTQAKCTRKTALTALAAMESVIEELGERRR